MQLPGFLYLRARARQGKEPGIFRHIVTPSPLHGLMRMPLTPTPYFPWAKRSSHWKREMPDIRDMLTPLLPFLSLTVSREGV
jgi:hypothetical protein